MIPVQLFVYHNDTPVAIGESIASNIHMQLAVNFRNFFASHTCRLNNGCVTKIFP